MVIPLNSVKHAVVMTFPAAKFQQYGFGIKGFVQNWPASVTGYAYIESPHLMPEFSANNLIILDFDTAVGSSITAFEQRNSHRSIGDLSIGGPIGAKAAKFARKVFVQLHALENIDADFIHYIDADLYTRNRFSLEMPFLRNFFEDDFLLACAPRSFNRKLPPEIALAKKKLAPGYTETGYIIWNMRHPHLSFWKKTYKEVYDSDLIFDFDEWHDCIAFDYATLTTQRESGSKIFDLGGGVRSDHPLVEGPLGGYLDHLKGGLRKRIRFSPERYGAIFGRLLSFLLIIVRRFKNLNL